MHGPSPSLGTTLAHGTTAHAGWTKMWASPSTAHVLTWACPHFAWADWTCPSNKLGTPQLEHSHTHMQVIGKARSGTPKQEDASLSTRAVPRCPLGHCFGSTRANPRNVSNCNQTPTSGGGLPSSCPFKLLGQVHTEPNWGPHY